MMPLFNLGFKLRPMEGQELMRAELVSSILLEAILGPSTKGNYDSYEVNMDVCKRENSVIFLEDDYSTTYKDYDDSPESQILLQLMQQHLGAASQKADVEHRAA